MSKIAVVLIGDISHDARVLKEIRTLVEFGHSVFLICTECRNPINSLPTSVNVLIIPKKSGGGLLGFIKNNLPFYFKVVKILNRIKPEYVHCNDLNTALLSLWVRHDSVKYVYDAHELYIGTHRLFTDFLVEILERRICKSAYAVISAQEDRKNIMVIKYPFVIDKIYLLENFPDNLPIRKDDFFVNNFDFYRGKKTIITYSGGISDDRCIRELIEAMSAVPDAVLFIIGKIMPCYKKELDNIILSKGLRDKIFFKNLVDNDKLLWLAASTDIGVCMYRPSRLNTYFSASNKLYEYLNSGTKVLSNATPSTMRVCNKDNSYLIDSITSSKIANAINLLRLLPKPSCCCFYWHNQINILKEIYK